jgi:hypothetical protein
MSGDTEDQLFGLMEIAQGHQTAVQAALEGLAAERVALRKERETLAREVRTLERSTDTAVREAVKASLAGAATEGAAAVQAATQPLLGRLASVTQDAGRAEAAMRKVVLWASWRLLSWVMAAAAGSVLLGWFASTAVLWWDNYDSWVKAGMLGKIIRCPGNRPCLRVDEGAGAFQSEGHNDYRIIQGY